MLIHRPSSASGGFRDGPRRRRRAARSGRRPGAAVQALEPRTLLAAVPIISEIVASNGGGLKDQDGDRSDWIELYNAGDEAIDLAGWSLTDDPDLPHQWEVPATILGPGGFLVVFASDKDRRVAGAELHTNFKLGADGDYLALVRPDSTVASSFDPTYPPQTSDVSYGVGFDSTQLVAAGATASVKVPTDGSLEGSWNSPSYAPDGSWATGATGVGYGALRPGFDVRYVEANVNVNTLADVDAVLATPALQASSATTTADVVNYIGWGLGGNFFGNVPYPTQSGLLNVDNFIVDATGAVTIPTSGLWTFGVNSDDGFRLTLERDGRVLTSQFNGLRSASDTLQTFDLEAGRYDIRLQAYDRAGGAEVELFAAPGSYSTFADGPFRLVGDAAGGAWPSGARSSTTRRPWRPTSVPP
ncbi:MAG: hypothetical protein BGO49_08155 [Planctomycetales bacterium 71-10]|nr:MAG: hypothetical protein BGO49_08155 [Planctomycetales bacterium 71-10]